MSDSGQPAVRFDGLGHAYVRNNWVFRNYAGAVERSRVFALLGPNGRGKTTLLKILLGVLTPSEGSVAVDGRVGFVPQLFQVSFDFTVLDIVLMGRVKHVRLLSQPSAKDEAAAVAMLDRFGMAGLVRRPFSELSGGQRQMVIFARALLTEASILILDEPTAALDLKNQTLVLDWIARLAHEDGLTVIFTTHHPHHALAVADDAMLMLDENRFVCGGADEVLTEENLFRLYGVPLKRVIVEHDGATTETLSPFFLRRTPHAGGDARR